MKRLLLSTAILGASTLSVSAQDLFRGEASPDEIRASDLMGMRVYAAEVAVAGDEAEGPQEGWEDIGEINDMVLARDGSVEAVLVDVGGFLGIGERQVAVSMDALRFVSDSATAEDVSDFFLVVNASRANLEEAPDYNAAVLGSQESAAAVEEASAATAAAGTEPTDEVVMTETEMEAEGTAEAATATDAGADAMAASDDAAATAETTVAEDGTTVTTVAPEGEAAAGADDAMAADAAATDTAATGDAAADGAMATEGEVAAGDATATEDVTATADAAAATTEAGTDEALSGAAAGRTPISREGYVAMGAEMMTADALQGAAVYDAEDNRVGEVGELLIDDSGQISDVVLDVGGFLGIGEKPVSLPMTSLDVLQQEGGEDLRVYVSQTREELEALEAYAAE